MEVDVNKMEVIKDLKKSNVKASEYVDLSGTTEIEMIELLIRPINTKTDWDQGSVEEAHRLLVVEGIKDLEDISFELRVKFDRKFKAGSIKRILTQESMDHFVWEGSEDQRAKAKDLMRSEGKSGQALTDDQKDYIYFKRSQGIAGAQIARNLGKENSASINKWIKENITLGSYDPNVESIEDLDVESIEENKIGS